MSRRVWRRYAVCPASRSQSDIEAMARGFTALLDGLVLQRVEEGDSYRRADMERRALAFLDLVAPRGPDDDRC